MNCQRIYRKDLPVVNFDEEARHWDSNPDRVERALAIANTIGELVKLDPPPKALEYGCGTGLVTFALHPQLGHITLADSSPGMIAVVQDKIANGNLTNMVPIVLDLTTDPLPDEHYDLIYTVMALHHVLDIEGILGKFYTLLESGGRLAIADLDKEDGSFHGDSFDGHAGFDRDALGSLLEKVGFCRIRVKTACQNIKERGGERRCYPVFVMVAEKP